MSRHVSNCVSSTTHLVATAPDTTVESTALKQVDWVADVSSWVSGGLGVADIVDEKGTHDSVGGLLLL